MDTNRKLTRFRIEFQGFPRFLGKCRVTLKDFHVVKVKLNRLIQAGRQTAKIPSLLSLSIVTFSFRRMQFVVVCDDCRNFKTMKMPLQIFKYQNGQNLSQNSTGILQKPPPPGGVLPYMGYIGMCRCEGYGFQAVYSRIGYINQSVWV